MQSVSVARIRLVLGQAVAWPVPTKELCKIQARLQLHVNGACTLIKAAYPRYQSLASVSRMKLTIPLGRAAPGVPLFLLPCCSTTLMSDRGALETSVLILVASTAPCFFAIAVRRKQPGR